jgi:hypothetical protein
MPQDQILRKIKDRCTILHPYFFMVLSYYIQSFDYTDFISKMHQNAPFCILLKKNSARGWGQTPSDLPLPLVVSRGLACMKINCVNINQALTFQNLDRPDFAHTPSQNFFSEGCKMVHSDAFWI